MNSIRMQIINIIIQHFMLFLLFCSVATRTHLESYNKFSKSTAFSFHLNSIYTDYMRLQSAEVSYFQVFKVK